MFGIPLHPIVVHFPIVLATVLPLAAMAALILGYRKDKGQKFWIGVVILNVFLTGFSFLAVQTGEADEEKVEDVLQSEAPLETHAEKGELFLKMTGFVLLATSLGLAPGVWGLYARGIGCLAAFLLLYLGMQVGHTGGQLVYNHGAASAFTTNSVKIPENSKESEEE